MPTFEEIAAEVGSLVAAKNVAYGNSFQTAGAALRLLYPNGIRPDQMDDAQLIVRIWDKLMRAATDRNAFGESPYKDILGYGILGVAMHEGRAEERQQGQCASVNGAEQPSKEPADDFVATDANAPTMPSANAPSVPNGSGLLRSASASTFARTGAPVPTATAAASASVDAHARWQARNAVHLCAFCGSAPSVVATRIDGVLYTVCSLVCADALREVSR